MILPTSILLTEATICPKSFEDAYWWAKEIGFNMMIDELAALLAEIHVKHTTQVKVKWHHLDASERSLWRLLARKAFEALKIEPEPDRAAS